MAIRNRGPGAANEQEEESGYSSSSTMVKSIGSDDPKDVKRRDSVSVPDNIVHAMQSLKKKDIRPFARALDIDDPDIENIFDDHRHDGNEEIKYQIALACIRRYGCEVVKFADALRKVGHGSAARELVPEVQALQETGYDGVREEQEGEHHHCKEEIYQRKYEEKGSRYSSSSRLMIKDKEKQPGYMIGNKIMITALTIILPCFVVFSRAPWLRHSSHRYSVFVGIACASIAAQMFRPKISRWFSAAPHIDIRKPARFFTGSGHDKTLRRIYENYRKNENKNDVLVEVLYGIGGCGKTEIASSYVWNNWRRYDHVFVLNGKSNSFLDYGFKKMLENMKMDLSDAEKGPHSIRLAALHKLSQLTGWLLLIDDVDDPRFIKQALPKSANLKGGHILMTSRVGTEWDDWFQTITTLVQPLTPEDSALYLIRHTKSPSTLQEANYTLKELKSSNCDEYDALMWLGGEEGLHGLPLALKQASNYIFENKVNFKKYKQLYENSKLDILEQDYERGPVVGWMKLHEIDIELVSTLQTCIQKHAHEIKTFSEERLQGDEFKMTKDQATAVKRAIDDTSSQCFVEIADLSRMNVLKTWKMNYEYIEQQQYTKEFLQLCSCLTTRIQMALLVDGARYLNPGALRDFIIPRQGKGRHGSKQMIHKNTLKLFQEIKRFSFATDVTESEEFSHARSLGRMGECTVHHLLQLAVFTRFIKTQEKVQCLNNAMRILENLFPKLGEIQDGSTGVLHDRHSIIAIHAQALAEKIMMMEFEELTDLNDVTKLFATVSDYLFRLGRPRDAKLICKAMVHFREGRKPLDELKQAEVLSYLGECYFEMGKLKKAEERFQKSLTLFKKVKKDENDMDVLSAQQRLARVQQNSGDYMDHVEKRNEVETLLKNTLKKKREVLQLNNDQDNLEIANAFHQLGRFYQDSKKYDEAHEYLKKSLEMRQGYWERKFGTSEVENVACSMTNLARNYILSSSNEVAETEELLNEAMAIKRKLMADTNEYYQLGVYYLAVFYRQQKSHRESEFAAEIILEEYKRLYKEKVELTDMHRAFPPEKMII